MAIIICPTLDEFVEFDMLSSKAFMKAHQRILSICIRNHTTKGTGAKKGKVQKLPTTISKHNKVKKFSVNTHSQKVGRITVTDVEELNGIEQFQEYIRTCEDTKYLSFYVMRLITQETCSNGNIFTWVRGNVHKDVKGLLATHTLSLTHINGKDAIKNYTQMEMINMVKNLTTYSCRIKEIPAMRRLRICTQ